ncbi:6284_t:CDS:2 [Cetraspora pellucida]|uniref:6284_t:CDS:1 n=1 Tax=Cetraspora pellucida TaxID=1433469 RepID=A0A9N9CFJ2_9GLOM|nr:6284_t:CDS:2 [Cetraspora pellucida]
MIILVTATLCRFILTLKVFTAPLVLLAESNRGDSSKKKKIVLTTLKLYRVEISIRLDEEAENA